MAEKRSDNQRQAAIREIMNELRGFREDTSAGIRDLDAKLEAGLARVTSGFDQVDQHLGRIENLIDCICALTGT